MRVRLLVGQVLSHLTERQLDGEKLAKQAQGLVSEKDVAAAVAALHFVLTNAGASGYLPRSGQERLLTRSRTCAAKYEVDEAVLAKELEQLGLPKGAPAATAVSCHSVALTGAARRARGRGVQAL